MTVDQKKFEYKVGAFVGIGVLLFLALILLLGGDRALFTSSYLVKIKLSSVEGLNIGSVVQLSGLRVGNVKEIDIDPESQKLLVTLRLDRKYQDRITQASAGSLRTQGALGDKYIYVDPGPQGEPALQDGQFLMSDTEGDFLSMLSKRGSEIERVFEILEETEKLLKSLNAGGQSTYLVPELVSGAKELNDLMIDLRQLVGAKSRQGAKSSELSPGSRQDSQTLMSATKHLASILRKIDSGEGTLGALVNDASLHDKIKSFLGSSPREQYMKEVIRGTIKSQER